MSTYLVMTVSKDPIPPAAILSPLIERVGFAYYIPINLTLSWIVFVLLDLGYKKYLTYRVFTITFLLFNFSVIIQNMIVYFMPH